MPSDLQRDEERRRKDMGATLHVLISEQEERAARQRAEGFKLPYINLATYPIDPDILEIVPRPVAEAAGAVLFYRRGNDVRVGVVNPAAKTLADVVAVARERFGIEPQLHVMSRRSLTAALSRYRREQEAEVIPRGEMRVAMAAGDELEKTMAHLAALGQRITAVPPSEVLASVMSGAVRLRSSDVHIEPKEKEARLRYRIDGVLQDIAVFSRDGWKAILSRVKALCKLKLNVHDVPQDGSFVLRIGDDTYDIRVSVLPGGYGENIVMRLLNRAAEAAPILELGMKERDLHLVERELRRVNGMILITGPTGSGKTTSLASFVNVINRPELKIITLEDPIEYRLPGVQQTQIDVDAGYTFAAGLRSILRQDPDMILVGEMRDVETAETAMHAALTGHLVLSTLHTNDAPGAVPRLVDMGIQPFIIAPALNIVIAQRLVRVVCPHCAQRYRPDAVLRERILRIMSGLQPDVFQPERVRDKKLELVRAKGCSRCAHTGYRGRKGVFEIFAVEGEVEQLVLAAADSNAIREAALRQGMTTIAQDGFLKVLDQITTVEEVERISEE